VSDQDSEREAQTPGLWADPVPDGIRKSRARKEHLSLWRSGALFHVSTRHPRKPKVARVDRLAGILRKGLVAPAHCQDGSVCSDLQLVVTGTAVPYHSLVFLHRFGAQSHIYTLVEPGRFTVFLDPELPVLTPEAMGDNWVVLCQDEVYVRGRVGPENLIGVVVHHSDAESVMNDFVGDFQQLGIPLYDYEGNVLWQPAQAEDLLSMG
jgi:hypothetical protein